MKKKFLSIRVSEELSKELDEAFRVMDKTLGMPSSKGWKVKMLLHLGMERMMKDGLFSKV